MGLLDMILFVVIVSGAPSQIAQGDSTVNVIGCKNSCIYLPCNCTNLTKGLKWQINKTSIYVNGSINEKYKGRITEHINIKNKDCSIVLNSITEEDNGSYQCTFKEEKEGEIYTRNTVILEVHSNCKVVTNQTKCPDPKPGTGQITSDADPQNYFTLLIIPALLLLFGCIWTVLRKQREKTAGQQFTALGTGTTPSSCPSQQDALNNL